MKVISQIAAVCLLVLVAVPANAAGKGPATEHANNEIENVSSLQRGARNYMNYCIGCHSLQYVRYNRIGEDLGLKEGQLKNSLIFGVDRANKNVTTAMTKEQGATWFGVAPPDLSLTARSRGTDWIYTYLKGFYADESRPFGVNNTMVPQVSMPHVLWELQGIQEAVYRKESAVDENGDVMLDDSGNEVQKDVLDHLNLSSPGLLSPEEYDEFVRDTVNFLDYVGEPMQLQRQSIGMMVLGFLAIFGFLAYALKKEFWKDIH